MYHCESGDALAVGVVAVDICKQLPWGKKGFKSKEDLGWRKVLPDPNPCTA